MKQFNIFKHPAGEIQVIKQGYCWPAFFFSYIWAMVSKMWVLGIGALIAILVLGLVVEISIPTNLISIKNFIINLVAIAISMYFGSNGNQLREKSLLSRGFELEDTVTASNKDGAVALFLKGSNSHRTQ